jgi:hypothetical protein
MHTVAGIFAANAGAARAVEGLRTLGRADERINVLAPGASPADLQSVPTDEGERPGTGAALGTVVGGAVGAAAGLPLGAAMVSLVVPGIGPVLASGLVAAAVVGAGGAAIGSALEHELTEGLPRDELFFYEHALREGRTVVIVLAETAEEAARVRDVLRAAGAESLDAARESWWATVRAAEEAAYRREGRDFAADEAAFRRGFEAALARDCRGRSFEDAMGDLRRRFPDLAGGPAFRRGYERGQRYLRGLASPPDEFRRSA